MNILIISNNLRRASFRQRVGIHVHTLRKHNMQCEMVGLPSGFSARFKLFQRASHFDGVLLQKKGLNFLDAGFLRRYAKKIIYDFDDAIMYSSRTPQRNSRSHFSPFRRTATLADLVIAGNSYLADLARLFNNRVTVLPTGLDTSFYKIEETPRENDHIRLAWIGSKKTLPYIEEITPALEAVGSRFPNVTLRLICDRFFDLNHMKVEKHQWSQETEASDLLTSDIGLAPLPDNRFTKGKCGFKILQYAAAGLPTVTSPVGVNSEFVREDQTGLHAKDINGWTKQISLLIENTELRKALGRQARRMAEDYDVKKIGQRLAHLISNVVTDSTS